MCLFPFPWLKHSIEELVFMMCRPMSGSVSSEVYFPASSPMTRLLDESYRLSWFERFEVRFVTWCATSWKKRMLRSGYVSHDVDQIKRGSSARHIRSRAAPFTSWRSLIMSLQNAKHSEDLTTKSISAITACSGYFPKWGLLTILMAAQVERLRVAVQPRLGSHLRRLLRMFARIQIASGNLSTQVYNM